MGNSQTDGNGEEGFSEHWLSLREPADHQARSTSLTNKLQDWTRSKNNLSILELGAGTGSNLRYLCPLLGHAQRWTLIDYDIKLLEQLPRLLADWAAVNDVSIKITASNVELANDSFSATVTWAKQDLASRLEHLDWASADLVTTSALLDLTSESWLAQLATLCTQNACTAYFVLNYDGRIQWRDKHEHDAMVNNLLNEHQRRDKGFGPALGPLAGLRMEALLQTRCNVSVEPSDWQISPDQQALQQALIDGWAPAAIEQSSKSAQSAQLIQQWHTHRTQRTQAAQSGLTVGHSDLLAIPA